MASTITGSNSADTLNNANGATLYLGLDGNDTIIAGVANDTLNGGLGNDDLRGGSGNDTYIIDGFGDLILENVNQGIDTLVIDANNNITNGLVINLLTLVNVENFDISQTGLQNLGIGGNNINNVLIGNDADNEISGFAGADSLIGGLGNDYLDGGAGIDTMIGGAGDDVYIVDSVADIITDTEGLNEVRATISYSIANNLAFDNLVLIGSAAINATGNSLNNLLLGNTGNNILDGGAGADAMEGGKGNDTYLWRDAGDTFFELANEGIDTLQLASNFGFAAGASTIVSLGSNIENLDASKIGGVAFDLEGNALNNVLTGNDANNDLVGQDGNDTMFGGAGNDGFLGGQGIDSLVGGIGDDIYAVNLKTTGNGTLAVASLEDIIVESSSSTGGIDSLRLDGGTINLAKASTIVLATGLEHLYAENTIDTKLNLTGNAAANNIIGNNAANIILGLAGDDTLRGGAGDDTLDGGAGNDVYLGGSGNDTYLSELVLLGGLTHVNDTYAADESGIDTIKFSGQVNSATVLELSLANLSGYENSDISNTGTTKINLVGNDENNALTGNAAANTITGGLGNDTLNGGLGNDNMNGGDGNDVYFVNSVLDVTTEANADSITGGNDEVRSNVSRTLGNNFENLTLLPVSVDPLTLALNNINATGNGLANTLTGNGGNNILNGLDGGDTLKGDLGNDTLNGGIGADSLLGGAGNDSLDGGTGADTMEGGLGNDIYVVDDALDTVTETLTIAQLGGIDTVKSTISYTLGDNVDRLILTDGSLNGGSAFIDGTGNALANILTGNAGNNILAGNDDNDTLTGNAGNDSLYGGVGNDILAGGADVDLLDGGTGNDSMNGGLGSDTYIVDSTLDVLAESATFALGGGIDTVQSTVTRTLGLNFDNLTLMGTNNINAIGNELANILFGNDGNNLLAGGLGVDTLQGGAGNDTLNGGVGNDSMNGGDGDDIYLVNSLLDITTETITGGNDEVRSNVSHILKDNIEKLTLLTVSIDPLTLALNNINGTGNALTNTLIGNGGNNILSGLDGDDALNGGAGADTLIGGSGNDTYTIDNALDKVIELAGAGAGIDTINSSVSYSLVDTDIAIGTAGSYVENLTLTGALAINGVGNALNNTLTGNNAANILNGLVGDDSINGGAGNDLLIGGLGADALTGGLGADRFDFNLVTETSGLSIDTIADFSHVQLDKIDLSTIDAKSGTALINDAFVFIGNAAFSNVAGQLMFDSVTSSIYGDVTGDSVADFQIILTGVTSLLATDFIL